jgi:hypothetical protein
MKTLPTGTLYSHGDTGMDAGESKALMTIGTVSKVIRGRGWCFQKVLDGQLESKYPPKTSSTRRYADPLYFTPRKAENTDF